MKVEMELTYKELYFMHGAVMKDVAQWRTNKIEAYKEWCVAVNEGNDDDIKHLEWRMEYFNELAERGDSVLSQIANRLANFTFSQEELLEQSVADEPL